MRTRIRRFRATRQEPPAPTFGLPNRDYYLLTGPIQAATGSLGGRPWEQSANLWWPDDRSWFVATEIDFNTTYIGGSDRAIVELLADPQLEAMRVELHHGIIYHSDRINLS